MVRLSASLSLEHEYSILLRKSRVHLLCGQCENQSELFILRSAVLPWTLNCKYHLSNTLLKRKVHVFPELNYHSKPQGFFCLFWFSVWVFCFVLFLRSRCSKLMGFCWVYRFWFERTMNNCQNHRPKQLSAALVHFLNKVVCFNSALYRLTHVWKNKNTLIYKVAHKSLLIMKACLFSI